MVPGGKGEGKDVVTAAASAASEIANEHRGVGTNTRRWYAVLGLTLLLSQISFVTVTPFLYRLRIDSPRPPDPQESFWLGLAISGTFLLLTIALPFAAVFLVSLRMPQLHSRRAVIYVMLIASLVSWHVAVITNHLVSTYVSQLQSDLGFVPDITSVAAAFFVALSGLPLFFVGFTSYVLATWRRTKSSDTASQLHENTREEGDPSSAL